MKITKILSLVAIAAIGTFFSACNTGDDPDYVITQTVPSCFNIFSTAADTDNPEILTEVSYKIDWNHTALTADLYVYGLKTPDGLQYPDMVFKTVPFKILENGWKCITATNLTPISTSGAVNLPFFSSIKFNVLDRIVNQNTYFPCFNINYSFGGYNVVSTTSTMLFTGTSEVADANGANGVSYTEPYYLLGYNHAKGTATIRGYNMKLNPADYSATLVEMRELPCTFDAAGRFSIVRTNAVAAFTSAGSVGSIAENDNMIISNLSATGSGDNAFSMALNFSCPKEANPLSGTLTVTCKTPAL